MKIREENFKGKLKFRIGWKWHYILQYIEFSEGCIKEMKFISLSAYITEWVMSTKQLNDL